MENNCKDLGCPVSDQNDDQSNENSFHLLGEHENQVSEGGGGANLLMHWKTCTKNPGHPEFIPLESFSLEHLPVGYHDSDLYDFIKATADLTVRFNVTMTSPDRPEFWPNSTVPYFLSDLRGKETLRTGSGKVSGIEKFKGEDEQTCPCEKCDASDKPSRVWWKIYVYTAAQVVFDDVEASHMSMRLFYDREDSPEVILKDKVRVDYVRIERDRCDFTIATCDETLGNKLDNMWKHYVKVWRRVINKYIDSRDVHKLTFIVSHPHGLSKKVSVGQWKDMIHVGDDVHDYKFTYTTCTCPGSSGAIVYCVGYCWYNELVHSVSLKSGLNCSGVGYI